MSFRRGSRHAEGLPAGTPGINLSLMSGCQVAIVRSSRVAACLSVFEQHWARPYKRRPQLVRSLCPPCPRRAVLRSLQVVFAFSTTDMLLTTGLVALLAVLPSAQAGFDFHGVSNFVRRSTSDIHRRARFAQKAKRKTFNLVDSFEGEGFFECVLINDFLTAFADLPQSIHFQHLRRSNTWRCKLSFRIRCQGCWPGLC